MISKYFLLTAMTGVGATLLGSLAISTQPQTASSAAVQKWEHLAMTVPATDGPGDADASRRIVALGNEGWELSDVEPLTKDGTTTQLIYFFKRPK